MLHNFSPWQASTFTGWLADSTEGQIVLVKQSYEFDEQGKVTAIEPGPDIVIADDYQDEPSNSPISAVNEQVAFKQGFEVYGNCTAYPPKGKDARVIEVELGLESQAQTLFKKRLRVTGARYWRRSLLGPVATDPEIIAPMAINYLHAYGGKELNNESNTLLENPIGRGYKLKNKHAVGQQLPSVEYANSLLRKPSHTTPVASFAAIPSHWSPRVERLQEIDETALMAGEYPFKAAQPKDLYNTAPIDQQVEAEFAKGWALQLTGLYPLQQYGQQQRIELPYQPPIVEVVNTLARERLCMRCDTLVIDSDAQCFSLLWRGHLSINKIGANSQILVASEQEKSDAI